MSSSVQSDFFFKTLPFGRVFTLKSYAKINLSLLVFQLNKEGYHPICSVFQEVSLYDILTVKIIPQQICSLTSNHDHFPLDHTNLLSQVYLKMKSHINYGLEINVVKNIPMGGGLGGGSSNAAALILFLVSFFKLKYTMKQLLQLAKSFGADIPFFLRGGTQLVRGIGDKLTPLVTKKRQYYVLIIPGIKIKTLDIFKLFDQQQSASVPIKTPKSILKSYIGPNSLRDTLFNFNPFFYELESRLSQFQTPQIQLSGTGSTLFFVVTKWSEAVVWEKRLSLAFKDCIIKAVKPIQRGSDLEF